MSELIGGRDALIILANGDDVLHLNKELIGNPRYENSWGSCKGMPVDDFLNDVWAFKAKPKTIKLELEIPEPFEPKDGDVCFTFDSDYEEGVYEFTYREDSDWHKKYIQFGVWDSLDKAKKVVAALRSIKK